MSASAVIEAVLQDAYQTQEPWPSTDAILSALEAAGYRVLGPGELDGETAERCAEAAEGLTATVRVDGEDVVFPAGPDRIAAAIRAMKEPKP